MAKWNISYQDNINNKHKNFIITAADKQAAIQQATNKMQDHNLNHFNIQLRSV